MQGKQHQRNKDQLNAEAAQWIFNGEELLLNLPRRRRG